MWLMLILSRVFFGGGFPEVVDFGVGEKAESVYAEAAVGDFADTGSCE
ncbi:MAG: hypothetical protein WBL85_10515 [Sedimentisphaerales bacterium]